MSESKGMSLGNQMNPKERSDESEINRNGDDVVQNDTSNRKRKRRRRKRSIRRNGVREQDPAEYILEWLKLLQQLQRQEDFETNSKYDGIRSLYLKLKNEITSLDFNNLPDKNELIDLIKSRNTELYDELVVASVPKRRRRRRRRGGRKGGRRGRRRGLGALVRLDKDKENNKSDEYSSSGEEEFERSRVRQVTKIERNEDFERNRFLKAFLPLHLQKGEDSDTKPEIMTEKEEEVIEKKEEPAEVTENEPKKTELEKELEIKMAKEIWGFVFNHVKSKPNENGKKNPSKRKRNSDKNDFVVNRDSGGGDEKNWDDVDVGEGKRSRRGGFTPEYPNNQERNMDDIDEYSGDEVDGNNESNRHDEERKERDMDDMDEYSGDEDSDTEVSKPSKLQNENDPSLGDMDAYSGDEEDGVGDQTRTTTNHPKKKKRKHDMFDADEDSFDEEDEEQERLNRSFDWGDTPNRQGYRSPKFSMRYNSDEDEEDADRVRRSRPSSSYDEVEIDRGLVIENISEYEFIGISMIWLKALSHFSHMYLFTPVISILDHQVGLCKGGIWGHMKCGVVPMDTEGNIKTNHYAHAVEDPQELIGKPFHFKLMIQSLKGDIVRRITDPLTKNNSDTDVVDEAEKIRRRKVETALFVKYKMEYIKDHRITDVCERITRTDEKSGKVEEGVVFKFEKEYMFPYVTNEILFFLKNSAVRFEIYMKKKYLDKDTKKTLFSI